jgi:GTP-binding protein
VSSPLASSALNQQTVKVKVFAQFVAAATDVSHFPVAGPPEIAFLGRSNVGKSSVINSLLGNKVARTSSTPGRTRGINFYAIRWPGRPRPDLFFTDLPGYGYAKVSRELSAGWHKFIEPYLKERPSLALCISLVDPNIPPQPADQQLCEFLRSVGRPHLVVATKADRISSNQLQSSLQKLKQALGVQRILSYSARSGLGRDQLWKEIRQAQAGEAAAVEPTDAIGPTPSPS